jgi:hypothetical protein
MVTYGKIERDFHMAEHGNQPQQEDSNKRDALQEFYSHFASLLQNR